jgi:hypothetical protein
MLKAIILSLAMALQPALHAAQPTQAEICLMEAENAYKQALEVDAMLNQLDAAFKTEKDPEVRVKMYMYATKLLVAANTCREKCIQKLIEHIILKQKEVKA